MNRLHVLALIIKYNENIFLLMCGLFFFFKKKLNLWQFPLIVLTTWTFMKELDQRKEYNQKAFGWITFVAFSMLSTGLGFDTQSFFLFLNTASVLWILKCFYKCAKEVDKMWSLDRNNNLKHKIKSQSTFSRLFLGYCSLKAHTQ